MRFAHALKFFGPLRGHWESAIGFTAGPNSLACAERPQAVQEDARGGIEHYIET